MRKVANSIKRPKRFTVGLSDAALFQTQLTAVQLIGF